jgi:hypothetical protein
MDDIEKCDVCDTPFSLAGTVCDVCQKPIGFPNVRLAIKESAALGKRYQMELESVIARNLQEVARDFETAVDKANVVIVRPFIDMICLIQNENKLISTFHQQVASGSRLAENNYFDPKRDGIESIIHPLYYDKIHYAALSLDFIGAKNYGEAHITLHNKYIESRTTFLEENSFNLVKKLQIKVGEVLPPGYRASWLDRGKLALCKYHANLNKNENEIIDFQNVLLVESDNPDFIEAHIYGSIHMRCIEAVTLLSDADTTSKILFNSMKNTFLAKGIKVEVRQA